MEYRIEKVKVDDESLLVIADVLKKTFPDSTKFSLEYLRWQYADNPIGEIVGYNAFYGDILAAHYVTMPIVIVIYGKKRKGLLSLNTATLPEHRGKRLFPILAEKTFEYAKENGYEYITGVANANSTKGFLKNLGFYLIAPLDIKFGFGNNIYSNTDLTCYKDWDEESIKWRMNNPEKKYYCKNNIITSPIGPLGVKGIVGKVDNDLGIKKKLKLRPINLYVGLGADLSKGLYFKIPSFIKHSPFNLIFKDLTGEIPHIKKEDVFFQLMDFDVI